MSQETEDGLVALCAWIARPDLDLPQALLARALRVLGDDLGAMLSAADEPELVRLRQTCLAGAATGGATLFAPGLPRADRIAASGYNAMAGCWNELDEGFRLTTCHAGLYVLPALLAEAEIRRLSLAQVLRALVLGYEVVTRVALAFRFGIPRVHAHAAFSSTGAAAGLALARGATAQRLCDTVCTAATLAALGPRGHLLQGLLIRNGWAAAGTACGAMAADWAAAGITGAPGSVGDVFAGILQGDPDPAALTAGLGSRWSIEHGYHKIFACCQHGHPTIDALLQLRRDYAFDPGDVTGLLVESHPLAVSLSNPDPATVLGGKFSLPHMAAAALVTGSGGSDAFGAAALADPRIARLRRLVRLGAYAPLPPAPHDRPARVTVDLADGRRLTAECLSAPGNPDRPIGDDLLLAKIRALSAPVLPGLADLVATAATDRQLLQRAWPDLLGDIAAPAPAAAPT